MKNIFILLLLITNCFQGITQDNAFVKIHCDKSNSSISYFMNHPLHSWTGVSHEVNSIILADKNEDIIKKVAVIVEISSFDSQNANRDSHTMEVTEALKYPAIKFESNTIEQTNDSLKVTGILTFHGIDQAIAFKAGFQKIKNKVDISGTFIVTLSQFKIDPPSLMGIKTDDKMKIDFNVRY